VIGAFAYRLGILVGKLGDHARHPVLTARYVRALWRLRRLRRLPLDSCPRCRVGRSWLRRDRAIAGRWRCLACGCEVTLSPVAA
jgi:hypothetical protein